jgi:hypothetical protein
VRTVPAPTAHSSTDLAPRLPPDRWAGLRRAAADVVPLLRFRIASLRGRGRIGAALGFAAIITLTMLAAWLPAELDGAGMAGRADDLRSYLPAACTGVLLLMTVAAVSGGGRELLPNEQAVAFPIGPTTDHFGALLMSPLNIAWLVQAWALLGANAYVTGSDRHLFVAQLPVVVFLVAATALAQAASWAAEWLRRGRGGTWMFRAVVVAMSAGGAALVRFGDIDLLGSPTAWIARGADHGADGEWLRWLVVVFALLTLTSVATGLGAWAAHQVARRPARDELRTESAHHTPRANPASDLAALVRIDRAGIWRSVPIRRGFLVLATLPGLGAFAGGAQWETVSIMPGPIASAAALLFGVNAWGLDGRGALWRESLPAEPRLVFASRGIVLLETVLLGLVLTVVLATLRAGLPSVVELVAVLCAIAVGSVQVVSASLRWSVRRPFAVDMRSARATPAPPLAMVGYSTRLALSTTLTGVVFVLTADGSHWYWSVFLAAPLLALSTYRLRRASRRWADPQARSLVVTTVAS